VGLREALDRWRARPEPEPAPTVDHKTSPPITQRDVPATLVVGSPPPAPPPDVPAFYRPAPDARGATAATNATDARGGALPAVGPQRAAEREQLRAAWTVVADRAEQLVRQFYAELFYSLGSDALRMFPPGMERQRAEFGRALVQWVTADEPEQLADYLDQLGADHRKFDVESRHYETAGQALVTAWSRLAGDQWTAEMESAVIGSYVRLASRMLDGALRRQQEPASWGATVTAHQRVLPDFAVVTVQPDEPYRFQPGQYLTLELTRQPKQWRQMSVASAPRSDNTLDLYVRAVSDTGVSGALVMHTAVGDRLRLGPPRGTDLLARAGSSDASSGGLVCVCSGTGAAPVVAVVEALVARPDCPEVEIFVGARDAANLIAVDRLTRLAERVGRQDRVRVHGVVSDDSSYRGFHGRVEDVVPRLRDWRARDVEVVVSGPNAMIAATVAAFTAAGVPADRIRFDQYDLPA
jgi:NAD(P)H-flavin reductase/hemoglobin-like flavoprotein